MMLGSLSETKVAYTSSAPANGLPGINYPARLSTGLSIFSHLDWLAQDDARALHERLSIHYKEVC